MKWHIMTGMMLSLLTAPFPLTGDMALASGPPDLKETRLSALHGDAESQYTLGGMYSTGKGADKDRQQAAFWYTRAAFGGHAEAQYQLGILYDSGDGVPQNYTQALEWLGKAAGQGHEAAKSHRGKILDHIKAVKSAAEKGELDAQCTLGEMYAQGNGVPQADDTAVSWFRKAAEQSSASGQYHLGFMYAEGRGVPQDEKEAALWFTKAAEQGQADAQYHLSALYFKGKGVPNDPVLAHAWLSLAAAQGHTIARTNQGFAASKLTPAQLAQAQTLAAELQTKNAKQP